MTCPRCQYENRPQATSAKSLGSARTAPPGSHGWRSSALNGPPGSGRWSATPRGIPHSYPAKFLAEKTLTSKGHPRSHLGLRKFYRRTGKLEKAQEQLTTATTMYRGMGMTYWLEQAEADRDT